jgi:hypothetical protein
MEIILFSIAAIIVVLSYFLGVIKKVSFPYLAAFFLPLGGVVNLFGVSFLSFLIIFYLVIIFNNTVLFRIKYLLYSGFFITLFTINSIKNSSVYEFLIFFNFIITILFTFVFVFYYKKNNLLLTGDKWYFDSNKLALCILTGLCFSFISGYFTGHEGQRLGGYGISPNILAALCLIALSLFLVQFKFKYILPFSFLLPLGLLTGSRLFLFGLVFIVFYVIFFMEVGKNNKTFYKILFIGTFFGALLLFVHYGFFDLVLERTINPRNDDITNSRSYLWESYLQHYISTYRVILFGGEIHFRVLQFNGIAQVPHNMLIEPLIAVGLIGTVLAFLLIYEALHRPAFRYFLTLPVLTLFLTGMTTHSFISVDFVIILLLGVLSQNSFHAVNKENY